MKYKKIVGFGDSWMWGDELLDPQLTIDNPHPSNIENIPYRESHCFLGLLGKHYGVPTENFGIPGGSLQSTIWTYLWWLENEQLDPKDCLVLVGLTEASRTSFYNPNHVVYSNDPPWNRFVHSAWVHSGSENNQLWNRMVKDQMALTDCRILQVLTYQQAVLFFEGQYYKLDKNLLQFTTMGPTIVMPADGMIWPDSGLAALVSHRLELLKEHRHPNELGHAVIRDHLIPEIDRVILA